MISSSEINAEFGWHILQCHPSVMHQQIKQVRCGIHRYKDAMALSYEVVGNINSIKLPAPQLAIQSDELWRHTCAELFVTTERSAEYNEFNFSPSSRWAAYTFLSYRQGLTPLQIAQPVITQQKEDSKLRIVVNMLLPKHYREAVLRVGLCMVIENSDGACSYWALQHDSPQPDFHRRENWLCSISI